MTIEEQRLEVEELTELLREDSDFADLRRIVTAQGLALDDTLLAGLISGEDDSQYGVLIGEAGRCYVFQTDSRGAMTRWEAVEDVSVLADDFDAVAVGVEMKRSGV